MKSIRVESTGRELWECPCGFVSYSFSCPICSDVGPREDDAVPTLAAFRIQPPPESPPCPDAKEVPISDLSARLAGLSLIEIERSAIRGTLALLRGNRKKAAFMLGIGERTLYRKIDEYGLGEVGT